MTERVPVPMNPQQPGGGGLFGGAQQQPQQQQQFCEQEGVKNVHINMHQWIQSYSKNPDPNKHYTTQINSTAELLTRAEGICGKIEFTKDIDGKETKVVSKEGTTI